MLPNNDDTPLVWTGNGNYRGCYATIEDATKMYNRLCLEGYVNRKSRKIAYQDIRKKIDSINKYNTKTFKDYPQVVENLYLIAPSEDKTQEFISMLEAAKNRKANWRKNFESEVEKVFRILAYPEFKVVARVQEVRNTDVDFRKVNWLERISKDYSATKINSDFILKQFIRNGSSPKSIFTSNRIVILELVDLVEEMQSLKSIYILAPDVLEDEDYYRRGIRRGISSLELKKQQIDVLSSINELRDLHADRIDIQVRWSDDIFLYDDPSLVITDLNWNTGKFKLCASASFTETLYLDKCRCRFYDEPDHGYISDIIARQMRKFETDND